MGLLRHLRQYFSLRAMSGPALLRSMGVSFSEVDASRRGFVVIQIDGLSHARMLKAMGRRQLPYMRKLVKSGRFKVHRYLSEIPTSTPAFQAGMFYGNNDNIPGFQFYDKANRRYYKMGYTECAFSVEEKLTNPGLLRGGSIFSGIFCGDADARMFVFSSMMAPSRWRWALKAWDYLVLTLLHLRLAVRIAVLGTIELMLALIDSVRFIVSKRVVRRQFQFIAGRLVLTVIAREFNTVGAIVDIQRRVPFIYANYLGYDEHAHMRGPDSAVAMWTLRGIDNCIRQIHKATRYSGREYDLFVISDHGQSAVTPFDNVAGESLAEFIQDEVAGLLVESYSARDHRTALILRHIDAMLELAQAMPRVLRPLVRGYAAFVQGRMARTPEMTDLESQLDVVVASTGPIAYIYWNTFPEALTREEIMEQHPGLVDKLVGHQAVGVVSMRMADGRVWAGSRMGHVVLGTDGAVEEKKGTMPFDSGIEPPHVARGIWRVTLMPYAGDICVWGDGSAAGDISYSFEFGAHSGLGDEQLKSFVLAPSAMGFDFGVIRRHAEFYEFFQRYRTPSDYEDEVAGETAGGQQEAC